LNLLEPCAYFSTVDSNMRHFLLTLGDALVYQRIGPIVRKLARGIDTLGFKLAKIDYLEECK
jgi:hypothetical protein